MTLEEAKELARRIRRDERRQPVIDLCDFLLTLRPPDKASGIRGGYQAPEGGGKPKAPTTGSGVFDREAYNAFMREYMRKWRERKGKKQR